jgi:putative flippase GtrA
MEKRPTVAMKTPASANELKRVGKFGVVGVINTIIDFGLYNVLSSKASLSLVQSNIISTTIAMVFSFFANRHVVFSQNSNSFRRQAVAFFLVTAFGIYVLQTGAIQILTHDWLWPVHASVSLAIAIGITGHNALIAKNAAKIIGTIISLTWNYIMYKRVVFN